MARIEHLGFLVADYDRTRSFYVDVLGARVVREDRYENFRFGFFAFDNIYFELIEPLDPDTKRALLGGDDLQARFDHVAIPTDDLEATVNKLRAAGVRTREETPLRYEPLQAMIVNTKARTSGGISYQIIQRDRPLEETLERR